MVALVGAVASLMPWWIAEAAPAVEANVRTTALVVPGAGRTGFVSLSPEQTGVRFTNTLTEWQIASNRVLLNGSGVAVGDIDRDGRPDLFFASLNGRNTLYRNLGAWRFEDVTETAGLKRDARFYRGAVWADVNGDSALDLMLAVLGGGVECWMNDGQGRFRDETVAARTRSTLGAMTMALADVDRNGTLDLYVANNRVDDIRDKGQVNLRIVNGTMVVPPELKERLTVLNGQVLEFGDPDQLYLNDGRGRFTPVSWTGGRFRDEDGAPLRGAPMDWGLTAAFRDLNGDGYPDLYVCNDFWTPDRIWLNDGKGRFTAAPRLAFRNIPASSMGVDFADVDRDGAVDLFVVDMLSRDPRLRRRQSWAQPLMPARPGAIDDRPQVMRNTLYRNRGDGTFAELANYAGVAASDWSWSPVFLDVDLDGYEDLLISSGHAKDVQDLDAQAQIRARQHSWKGFPSEAERQKAFTLELMEHMRLYPPLDMPIVAFRNRGGFQFEETTAAWGTAQAGVHHALASADLDGDGDLDLVVNNLGSAAGLYRNDSPAPRVAVRLRGAGPNTQGIGAKIALLGGAVPRQSAEVVSGGRYLAGSDPLTVFACGPAATGMVLEISWASGRHSRVENVAPNQQLELVETGEGSRRLAMGSTNAAATRSILFADISSRLNHVHHEEMFDDFARQPLLPFRLSQTGPGSTLFDLDGDGVDELFIGAGRGGQLGAWWARTNGQFEVIPPANASALVLPDDSAGLAGWVSPSGARILIAGLARYENARAPALLVWTLRGGKLTAVAATNFIPSSAGMTDGGVGAIAVADFDQDGHQDAFLGGAVLAGRYPEASASGIFRARAGRLEPDTDNTRVLAGAGLVNAAVWGDLDGDKFPELILACEWGPIRVFAYRAGRLSEVTGEWGLAGHRGWWRSVVAADLDGDGRLDLVAANWGLNSAYRASAAAPLRLFYGELGERGVIDLIETEYDDRGALLPRRTLDALAMGLPVLREQFPTHEEFTKATMEQVLGNRQGAAREMTITTLASMVFLNRGGKFEGSPLPAEAQWAPASGVIAADFDGDNVRDIFLSQNFFAMQPEVPRLDAGRGLWLRGLGRGTFVAVPAAESGLAIDGEQRGTVAGDFDRDGLLDLVVTQNGAATRVFRNQGQGPARRTLR